MNEDICNLSTLCATKTNQPESVSKDELLDALQNTPGENGQISEFEIASLMRSMRKEVHFTHFYDQRTEIPIFIKKELIDIFDIYLSGAKWI